MNLVSEGSSPEGVERFLLPATRERWLEFVDLEHATFPLPLDFTREGEELVVRRARIGGRKISAGRIPKDYGAALFLQAAALFSFLQAAGFWLDEEDLCEAVWDFRDGTPRLWLTRTPASVRRGGPGPSVSAVLAAFLHRLFARGRKMAHPAASRLFDRLLAEDASFRRAEFWVSSAFRIFPQLSSPASAQTRMRTVGFAGGFFRDSATRARLAKARAHLTHRVPRVFGAESSALTAGSALGLQSVPGGVVQAARALRERHVREAGGRRALWIAVEPERWDLFSRRAFDVAAHALAEDVETLVIPLAVPPPCLSDEWRREVFVPCGTLGASLRFYEGFAEVAREDTALSLPVAERILSSSEWGAFVADATGDAPLPLCRPVSEAGARRSGETPLEQELLELLSVLETPVGGHQLARILPRRNLSRMLKLLESRGSITREGSGSWRLSASAGRGLCLSVSRRQEICRRWARVEEDSGRRLEWLLAAGETEEALAEAERWFRGSGAQLAEKWFELSSRLAAAAGERRPPWLDLLEAERELAGGRPDEAEKRLLHVAESPAATLEERRAATLRSAEVCVLRGQSGEAGRRSATWRRAYGEAPPEERVRALRVEAKSRARDGEHDAALALLDEADRVGARLSAAERLETALLRAGVYSLAGRFREEMETYEQWRAVVLEAGDDLLTARLLAREALGLSDRREFAQAVARLKEGLAVVRDDPVERARLLLDLSATLYHAGRPGQCAELLDEAMGLAAAAGRQDLVRVARGNRLELAINRGEWEAASREIEVLLSSAREEADSTRQLVALHHRSRLALRRGHLEAAARDNEEARALAERLADRLEIGELWLEEGDRCVYAGDLDAARRAYGAAASDPPDRCDSDLRARERLNELTWEGQGGPPEPAREALRDLFGRDEYAASETVARWHILFRGSAGLSSDLRRRAERVLRARGGAALADRVFGRGETPGAIAVEHLRDLRSAVADALLGEEREGPLAALGLSGLVIKDGEGHEVACLGTRSAGVQDSVRRKLDAGRASYELSLWPDPGEDGVAAIALMLETLLFRHSPVVPPSEFAEGWRRLGVVAGDASMEEPYRRLVRFAPQPVTVLILGESGSGKEAVARAVHALSLRAPGPFVAVNISAIPPALLESELFGHARGAFTGADRDRSGLLEEAARGTIFFDEIGDLSLPLQAKLLRTLQEREIRRVGENRSRPIDIRVVSATSRNLAREAEAGRFREDLYYRLHVAVIRLPPLRERGRDAALLARHLLSRYAREYGRGDLHLAPETLSALAAHSWPGNVRELQNVMAQAAALAEKDGVVSPAHLPEPIRHQKRLAGPADDYRSRVDAHRRDLITEALERTGGNRSRAARDLGLSRQALLYLIRELKIAARPSVSH